MNSTHDTVLPDDAASYGRHGSLAVEIVVIVAALVACVMRFSARIMTKAGLGLDDWAIFAAVVVGLVTAGILLAGEIHNPTGAWVADHPSSTYIYTAADQLYLKLLTISSILYFTIASTTKLGILCMYHRIFSLDVQFRRSMYAVGFLVMEWWVGTTIASLTSCIPLEWSWRNGFSDPKYCFNFNVFWLSSGVVEVLLDIMILILPIRAVLHLQLSKHNKIRVIAIFLLGGFTVITGLVRVVLGYNPEGRIPFHTRAEVWTTVHSGMSIVCACLPISGPLVRRIQKSRFVAEFSKLFSPCRSHRHRYERRGHYEKNLSSNAMSDSPPQTMVGSTKFMEEHISYDDAREMYALTPRVPAPHDIENIPEPAWQPARRAERLYRTNTNQSRLPSFMRLTLNLDDVPLDLNAIRRQSTLIPEE